MSATERSEGARRFAELASARYLLEEEAEARMIALLTVLEELRVVDKRQRQLVDHVDLSRSDLRVRLGQILSGWLKARLVGGGHLHGKLVALPEFKAMWLPELDPLARQPTAESKGETT